ncbi:MAG: sigma-E processing peptidase SpoIIGA [Clostridia bacterium]|nr:sigma-E processing peptidase SpoIIGA [Clostridia bacterium]
MTIYLDVVILENLCMNYIILFATGIINKTKIQYLRIFFASLLGSLYAAVSYISIIELYSNIVVKVLLSICMVYISFKSEKIKKLLKQLLIFYLTSFTFGGVSFALLYVIKPQDILMRNGVYIGTYPVKIVLISAIIGFVVLVIAFKIIRGKINKSNMYCDVKINLFKNSKTVKAIIDTGNFLKDPITGVPVIVVEKEAIESFINKDIIDNLEKIINGNIDGQIDITKYSSRIRLIPFSSLGRKNGLLLGINVDSIDIEFEDVSRKIENAIIGIYDDVLSSTKKYNALVGLELIEKSEEIGAVI